MTDVQRTESNLKAFSVVFFKQATLLGHLLIVCLNFVFLEFLAFTI